MGHGQDLVETSPQNRAVNFLMQSIVDCCGVTTGKCPLKFKKGNAWNSSSNASHSSCVPRNLPSLGSVLFHHDSCAVIGVQDHMFEILKPEDDCEQ
eukprot:scaffold35293_cov260-Amphora_coffeaeformis.AAC.2